MKIEVEMKILVYGAGVMAQYVKESIINSSNEFIGFIDPLGNGDFKNLEIKIRFCLFSYRLDFLFLKIILTTKSI